MPNLPADVIDAALNSWQRQQDEKMAASLEQQAAPVRQQLFNAQVPDLNELLQGLNPMQPAAQPQPAPAPQQQPAFSFQMPSLNDLLGDLAPKPQPQQPVATPSGTPAAMPSAPRTVDATITAGPRPDQQLRPGESVGSVTLGDGTSAQQPAPSGGDYGPIDNSSRQSFVRTAYPYMLDAAGGDRNLAELMLAKAISENGDVGKGGGFIGNNFSGIKGVGSAGSFEADTWEDYGNGRVNIRDKFAAYRTPQEGFQAFMGFLRENERYAPALANYQRTGNADALFDDILAAGYATDKQWANKVRSIRDTQVAPYVRQQTADTRQSLNAGSGSVPSESAPSPTAGAGAPPTSASPDTQAMWSPDMPSEAERGQGEFQAATGRSGGAGVMYRGPLGAAPAEVGNDAPEPAYSDPTISDPTYTGTPQPYGPPLSEAGPEMPTSYNDPTDGGTISTPVPAPEQPDYSYTLADGRTEPPTPTGTWEPVQTIPNPQRQPVADPGQWLAEDSQSTPPEPVAASPLKPVWDAAGNVLGYVQEGAANLVERIVDPKPIEGRTEADRRLLESARSIKQPIDEVIQPTARAIETTIGGPNAPEGSLLQAAQDASGVMGPDGPVRAFGSAVRSAAPVVREAAEGARGLVDDAVEAGGRLLRGSDATPAPLPSSLGSGFRTIDGTDPLAAMRTRVVPPDVADTLDFPIRVPEDPAVVRAIEAAGGRVDPERGVDLYVTRAQGPDAAGGVATRGGVFYEAIPEGGRSSFVQNTNDPNNVGGSTVIPRTPTRFRSPLILSDAPGSMQGFGEAAEQLGIRGPVDRVKVQRLREVVEIAKDDVERGLGRPEHIEEAQRQLEAALRGEAKSTDIDRAIRAARQAGPEGSPARAEALKEVVRRYGGTPDEIDALLAIRGADASESTWAIKENILAAHARRNGYDGVVTVQAERVPYADLAAHPAVKAAQDANNAAWREHEAAQDAFHAFRSRQTGIRGPLDPPPSAEEEFRVMNRVSNTRRAVDETQEALRLAEEQAQKELARGKITELVDVREGRNPTPGRLTPESRKAEISYQAAKNQYDGAVRNGQHSPEQLAALQADMEQKLAELRQTERTYTTPPGYTLRDDIPRRASTSGGSGFVPRLSDAQNAAQGGVIGAASELTSDEELTPQERLARMAGGAALGVAAGRRMRGQTAATRLGSGVVPNPTPSGPRRRLRSQAIRATDTAEVSRLRLDKFPEDVRELVEAGARQQDWARTQRRGVISDEAVQQMADDDVVSVDTLIKRGKAGKTYNAEETVALRNAVASQASVVRQLSDEIAEARANGMTPDLLIARRAAEATRLNGLINVAEGARAEAGRALRAYRQQARLIELNPEQAIQQIYRRLGGKENAEAAIDEYTKLVQDGANPIQLAKFWAKIENGEIKGSDLFALYRRFNMLSGPRTIEVNALSGAVNLGYELVGQALGQAVRGRVREAAAELAAPFKAMGRAFQNMAETARFGVSEDQALRGDIPRTLSSRTDNKAAKAALTVMELPDRFNAAVDQFYRTMTEDWAATMLAHKQARQAGVTTRSKDWAETVAKNLEAIRDDPTKFPEIKQMADHVTFSEEPGALGKGLEQLRRQSPLIMNAVAPFIRTPYNIASRAVDMSPIGVARTAVEAATGMGRGRENISRRVRDNLIGVAGAVWAYNAAQDGKVTGAGPDDPEKRAMLMATGWQPYSIKIGDTYWSYANVAPFSLMLASGAAAYEAQKYAKPEKTDTLSMLADGAERTAKVVTDMTVLAGIGAVVKSIQDPDRYGGQWLTQYLQTLIPAGSALNTVGQMQDPNIRRAERDTLANQVQGGLMSRVPGLREQVPAAQTSLGQPVPNNQTGAAALIPVRPSSERPDPVMQAFLDAGVDIGKPREEITIGSVKIELTPAEQRQWNTLRGQEIERRMQTMLSSGLLDRLPPARRVERLETIKADAAERASSELWRTMPVNERNQRRNDARKAG